MVKEVVKYIREQSKLEYEDLCNQFKNELKESFEKVEEFVRLRKVLVFLENKLDALSEGVLFVKSTNSEKTALDINRLGQMVENEINDGISYDDLINKEWLEETISKNASFMLYDEVKYRYEALKNGYDKEYQISLEQFESVKDKLKWKGSLNELGFIFSELARLGYIERPVYSDGKNDQSTFALKLHSAFEKDNKPVESFKESLKKRNIDSISKKFYNSLEKGVEFIEIPSIKS